MTESLRGARLRQCQAVLTIPLSEEDLGGQLKSFSARAGSATKTGGSPGRRVAGRTLIETPPMHSTAATISRTETPHCFFWVSIPEICFSEWYRCELWVRTDRTFARRLLNANDMCRLDDIYFHGGVLVEKATGVGAVRADTSNHEFV